MKIRSLAMLAMSGLLAASFAYVTPAMADDNATDQSSQAPAATDNGAASQGSDSQGGSSAPQGDNSGNSSSDQPSPDTATGDDDY